jgi:PTH1 family peptidyl-tRNA hydrolase
MWNFLRRIFLGNTRNEETEDQYKEDPMKYLVAGLGNVGSKYAGTRHNIGFDVLDELARMNDVSFTTNTLADTATFKYKGRTFILIKPTTYMNLSGKAVRYWMTKHKIPIERTLIVLDDLNLDFTNIRIRGNGKDGGHNGLKNINELLQTSNYPRLRMGIGDNFSQGKQVNFVLGKWSEKEEAEMGSFIDRGCRAILDFTTIGLARTMSAHNGKG